MEACGLAGWIQLTAIICAVWRHARFAHLGFRGKWWPLPQGSAVLGICNASRLLTELGLLPGRPDSQQAACTFSVRPRGRSSHPDPAVAAGYAAGEDDPCNRSHGEVRLPAGAGKPGRAGREGTGFGCCATSAIPMARSAMSPPLQPGGQRVWRLMPHPSRPVIPLLGRIERAAAALASLARIGPTTGGGVKLMAAKNQPCCRRDRAHGQFAGVQLAGQTSPNEPARIGSLQHPQSSSTIATKTRKIVDGERCWTNSHRDR